MLGLDALLLAFLTLEDDGVIGVLVDKAGGNHLVDDGRSLLPFLAALLELPDLGVQPGNLGGVDLCLHLLRDLSLLVLLDLLFPATALRLYFHHIGGSTFALCKKNKVSEMPAKTQGSES